MRAETAQVSAAIMAILVSWLGLLGAVQLRHVSSIGVSCIIMLCLECWLSSAVHQAGPCADLHAVLLRAAMAREILDATSLVGSRDVLGRMACLCLIDASMLGCAGQQRHAQAGLQLLVQCMRCQFSPSAGLSEQQRHDGMPLPQ